MPSVTRELRDRVADLVALVAPILCDACGKRCERSPCPSCRTALTPARGAPDGVASAYLYRGPVARSLMHRFKYRGAAHLAPELAGGMVRVLEAPPEAVLVPVPASAERARERGYDQAWLLASALGRLVRRAVFGLVVRARSTRSQTTIGRTARAENLIGAFAVRAATPYLPVVLIDDVHTTGATLRTCRDVLEASGHVVLGAVTAFRAPDPDAAHELSSTNQGTRVS